MKLKLSLMVLCFLMLGSAGAQMRYGFKTGLNFANISGPSEKDASGNALEKFGGTTGFHIGVTFSYKVVDNFGFRGEVLYSKKGTKYTFKGPSYYIFDYTGGSTMSTGTADYLINVNNAYIDVPVLAYVRMKSFELSAGAYIGFLIQSVGDGSFTYSDAKTVPLGNTIYADANGNNKYDKGEDLQFNLDYNYNRNNPGAGTGATTTTAKVDGHNVNLLKTVGAYYDYTTKNGNLYNRLDYGLTGGITYFLSHALYASLRLQYGLADVTNNNVDRNRTIPAGVKPVDFKAPTLSNDKDRNFVIQASVGFSF
jgi:hypothetical protein